MQIYNFSTLWWRKYSSLNTAVFMHSFLKFYNLFIIKRSKFVRNFKFVVHLLCSLLLFPHPCTILSRHHLRKRSLRKPLFYYVFRAWVEGTLLNGALGARSWHANWHNLFQTSDDIWKVSKKNILPSPPLKTWLWSACWWACTAPYGSDEEKLKIRITLVMFRI